MFGYVKFFEYLVMLNSIFYVKYYILLTIELHYGDSKTCDPIDNFRRSSSEYIECLANAPTLKSKMFLF